MPSGWTVLDALMQTSGSNVPSHLSVGSFIPKPDASRVRSDRHDPGPRGADGGWCRLEPSVEADLTPEQYAYRPGRSAHDASAAFHAWCMPGTRQS